MAPSTDTVLTCRTAACGRPRRQHRYRKRAVSWRPQAAVASTAIGPPGGCAGRVTCERFRKTHGIRSTRIPISASCGSNPQQKSRSIQPSILYVQTINDLAASPFFLICYSRSWAYESMTHDTYLRSYPRRKPIRWKRPNNNVKRNPKIRGRCSFSAHGTA
ncbi:hypothetical protein HDV63DRAFT_379384 [Trichoderma sp. SZMC 28014]